MRCLLIFCVFSFLCFDSASQKIVDVDKEPAKIAGGLGYLYTVGGTPFINAKFSRVVSGSPFFNEKLMRGSIILSEGREYKNLFVRLNLLESQVNYLDEKDVEMIASTQIREVVLWDTISNKDHRFISSDYIETTGKPERDFYELLQKGKAELYKQYKKNMLENKPYGSATIEQTIQTYLRYYVLVSGRWTKLNRLKDLPTIFPDKKDELSKFISAKKLSGDNEKNYEAIITYYNSLLSQ